MLRAFTIGILFTFIFAVDYSTEIQPIFNSNCTNCHHVGSSSFNNHELDLTSYSGLMSGGESGDVVIPFNSNVSILYQLISSGDMPPNNNDLSNNQVNLIALWIDEGALEVDPSCDDGYLLIEDVPNTCIVFDGSNCFYEADFQVLADIAESNEIFNLDPLYLGSQNWLFGRLIRIQVGNYFQGGNVDLISLPASLSDLDSLTTLQVDKNSLTALPEEVGDLSNLSVLIASNNFIESLPETIGQLSQVWYLDLGYNNLETLPSSISNMSALVYLYLFGNNLSSLPESICDLDLDWSGYDYGSMPYFACGGNQLCEDIPECVANSSNFEIGLEANYYSFTITLPQDCEESCDLGDLNSDGNVDILDVVSTVNIVLGNNEPTENQECAADMNSDGVINVLDVVTMVNLILN